MVGFVRRVVRSGWELLGGADGGVAATDRRRCVRFTLSMLRHWGVLKEDWTSLWMRMMIGGMKQRCSHRD